MAQWLWTQKQDIGPSQRTYHAMAYDAANKLVLLFGGQNSNYQSLNDTWAWDGQAWTQVADMGPTPRKYHAMTFDSVRQRTVLHGGSDGDSKNDTWEWDGGLWTQVADTGPTRLFHTLTFDSVRRRVVLFGGYDGGFKNDTWEWDGGSWTQVADTGPHPRTEHAMTFDSERQRVVLFGGYYRDPQSPVSTFFNDTWEWDGAVWKQVEDTGPSPRANSAMVHMGTRTVLFGGNGAAGQLADTWEWKDLRWTQRQNMGVPKRLCHDMAYDIQRDRIVLFGGFHFNPNIQYLGDTWELAVQ